MYQYGNVAVQYKKERKRRPVAQRRPITSPQPQAPRREISTGEKLLYLVMIISMIVIASLLLVRHATINQFHYEVQYLEREIAAIEQKNANLQLEVATLSSPDRIRHIAEQEWGMSVHESTVRILSIPTPLHPPIVEMDLTEAVHPSNTN